jgi:hypothetical protein
VYDAIVSEPSNPWLKGVANLFTAEFYRHEIDGMVADMLFQTLRFVVLSRVNG